MATGIAQTSCINEYVYVACQLTGGEWAKANRHRRAGLLIISAAAQLTKFSIPNPAFAWEEMKQADGLFDYQTWRVKFSPASWDRQAAQGEEKEFMKEIAKLADTVYHEYRHCEQWFRMARFLASTGKTAVEISALMTIGIDRAQEAVRAAALTPEELNEGQVWYNGVYGRPVAPKVGVATATAAGNFNRRDLVLTAGNLRSTAGPQVTGKSEKSNVQADELAAIGQNRQMSQYLQYRNLLPEEADAHAVGTEVQKGIYFIEELKGEPKAPAHAGVRAFVNPNVTST